MVMNELKTTYVGETLSLHCKDGELHISFGDVDRQSLLIMNVEQLYKDLPSIINLVAEEHKKMQVMYLDDIKESVKEL